MGFRNIGFCAAALCVMAAAGSAQACQLVCQKTSAMYDGNLGGLTGADAKCVTEFGTGWKFPRSASLAANTPGSINGSANSNAAGLSKFIYGYYSTFASMSHYAWLGSMVYNPSDVRNCSNWSSNSASYYGGTVANNSGAYIYITTCDTQLPLICCNM